jgi:hypothetical protein
LGSWSNAQPSKLVKEKNLETAVKVKEVTALFIPIEDGETEASGAVFVDGITAKEFADIVDTATLGDVDTFPIGHTSDSDGNYRAPLFCDHEITWRDETIAGKTGILVSDTPGGHSAVIFSVLNAIAVENDYAIDWSDFEDDKTNKFRGYTGFLGMLLGEYRTWQDCILPYQLN